MHAPIRFLLNDEEVETECSPGLLVLDFLRRHRSLNGTKEGCKEGDCGACAVLVGELNGSSVRYQPVTSCLLPVGEVAGKHVVTIEGFKMDSLTPVQRAIVEEGGTQCGFCTPGIAVSMHGLLMDDRKGLDREDMKYALSGHLCRCTGYRSLIDCSTILQGELGTVLDSDNRIGALVKAGAVPSYFGEVPDRLRRFAASASSVLSSPSGDEKPDVELMIAGGTDLYVQMGDCIPDLQIEVLNRHRELKGIRREKDCVRAGALTTFEEFGEDPTIREIIPEIGKFNHLIASWQIRNRATLSGNIINASPIGDLTVLLLALETKLVLKNGDSEREIPLKQFYKGYKQLDREKGEILTEIRFPLPPQGTKISFEKVSKRTCLDIASVNSACRFHSEDGIFRSPQITLGGVAPIPLFLHETCRYLEGRPLDFNTTLEAIRISQEEISPVTDVRGSADYRRLLARQLLIAHFTKLYPDQFEVKDFYETH